MSPWFALHCVLSPKRLIGWTLQYVSVSHLRFWAMDITGSLVTIKTSCLCRQAVFILSFFTRLRFAFWRSRSERAIWMSFTHRGDKQLLLGSRRLHRKHHSLCLYPQALYMALISYSILRLLLNLQCLQWLRAQSLLVPLGVSVVWLSIPALVGHNGLLGWSEAALNKPQSARGWESCSCTGDGRSLVSPVLWTSAIILSVANTNPWFSFCHSSAVLASNQWMVPRIQCGLKMKKYLQKNTYPCATAPYSAGGISGHRTSKFPLYF